MTVSNKKLLLALALFAPDEAAAFAIPSLGRSASIAASCQRTTSVAHGEDCTTVARRCNIPNDDLVRLNPEDNFCSNLRAGQLICCSNGIQPRSPAGTGEDDDSQDSAGDDQGSGNDGRDSNNDDQDSNGDTDDKDSSSGSGDTPDQDDDDKTDDDKKGDGDKDDDASTDKDNGAQFIQGARTGNWSKLTCKDPAARDKSLTPQQKWEQLGAAAAFQDAVDYFKKVDRPKNAALPSSIIGTLLGPTPFACQNIADQSCAKIAVCPEYSQEGTGPAGMLIQNSFANIRSMYTRADFALSKANNFFQPSMDSFINAFAPVPPPKEDNQWLDFFVDIATMGAAAGLGRMVKAGIKEFSTLAKAADHNDVKAAAESLLGGAVGTMKKMHDDKKTLEVWNDGKQKDLKAIFGTIFYSWSNMTSDALSKVFAADDDAITRLGNLINDGKMISNATDGSQLDDANAFVSYFGAMMFATAAPQAWRLSNNLAFVVDMGVKCNEAKDVDYEKNRIDSKGLANSKACIDDHLYYLAMVPDGKTEDCPMGRGGMACNKQLGECFEKVCTPNYFSLPPGSQMLDGHHNEFANINAEDIIKGSVLTYKKNENKNGGKSIDFANADTILAMADDKPSVAGMYRLPVCSGETALKNWKNGKRTDNNYPC